MSRQRLRQSFIQWKTELSDDSFELSLIYKIKEAINSKKYKNISVKVSPYMEKLISKNYQTEILNIQDLLRVNIKFFKDEMFGNLDLEITEMKSSKKSETTKINSTKNPKKKKKSTKKKISKKIVPKMTDNKKKEEVDKKSPQLKEIKNKKKGWWQK